MNGVQLKNTAINLRKSGLSYGEIIAQINVSKSTLSYWLSGISLNDRQEAALKSRLVDKQKRGRFSTAIALRARKVFKEKMAFDAAEKEFAVLSKDTFFMSGIVLYWAEGGKKGNHFQFVNSDPEMILMMVVWIGKYLKIPKNRLSYRIFIKEAYSAQNIEGFWEKTLHMDRIHFKKTIQRTPYHGGNAPKSQLNPYYKGSCMITITNVSVLRKMLAWQNLLIKYYKGKHSG